MPKKTKKEAKPPAAPRVVYADGDDWAGLYVNGELRAENHSLRVSDVLEALGIEYERIECDQSWLEERGRLPERVEDVKGRKERPKRG